MLIDFLRRTGEDILNMLANSKKDKTKNIGLWALIW